MGQDTIIRMYPLKAKLPRAMYEYLYAAAQTEDEEALRQALAVCRDTLLAQLQRECGNIDCIDWHIHELTQKRDG